MSDKIQWQWLGIGWALGAGVAFVGVHLVPNDKEFLVIGAMILLPFALESFHNLPHSPTPPSATRPASSPRSAAKEQPDPEKPPGD